MMKKNFKNHISGYWFLYVIAAVISAILWSTVVIFWTKDKKEEVVSVWIMAYDAKVGELTNELENEKQEYLKHIRLTFNNYENELTKISFDGLGSNYDLAILPESFLSKVAVQRIYTKLDSNLVDTILGEQIYYQMDEYNYGIEIFNKSDDDNGLITYTKEGIEPENYYIFINKNSLHMGEINNSKHDGGISIIKTLLK
ncbi:MAG: hypothetical protein J6M95_03525 [Bacilli bacterium]|nr:hypothetical protein [Bacilli bacterium]